MALALPVPLPPTVAFPSPVSLSSFPGMIRKVTSKAAPLVVLGGLLVAVQKKALGLSNDMEGGWVKRAKGTAFGRTVEVWRFAFSFLFKFLKVRKLKKSKAFLAGDKSEYSEAQSNLARILKEKILELGPTFIKLGQLLSTRVDVVPKEYIEELKQLQDQVPGFSGDLAVQLIEQELGKPITQLFDKFEKKSIAAASLGQVHIAYAKGTGQKLAVKVQRQGLKELFDMDLKNIKLLAKILDAIDPKADGAQRNWVDIYDESARLLYKEIDYRAEAENSIRFKNNFKNVPWVKVPEVYMNMTTPTVIVMEFVPGIKINDINAIEKAGIDKELLAKRSAESYLSQICRYGYFHCDPHPGNVACDAVEGGRLIYYDFGMMDELKPEVRKGLVDLIFGVYENEPKAVCDAAEEIGILRKNVDRISVEKLAKYFVGEFYQGSQGKSKFLNQMTPEEAKQKRRQRRQQLANDLFTVGSDVPFRFPPTFTFVFRAFTSLDGIGKGLDEKYDLTKLARPYLKELLDLRDGSPTMSFLKTFGKKVGWRPVDINNAVTSPRKIAYLEETLSKMEQGDLKVRVRALESEKEFARLKLVQSNQALLIAASGFLNVAVVLASSTPQGATYNVLTKAMFGISSLFGIQIPIGLLKLYSLDKKIRQFKW